MSSVIGVWQSRSVRANEVVEVIRSNPIDDVRTRPSVLKLSTCEVFQLDELSDLEDGGRRSWVAGDVVASLLL